MTNLVYQHQKQINYFI